MKKLNYFFVLIAAMSLAISCDKPESGGNGNGNGNGNGDDATVTEQRNQWIYDNLSEWYLWRDDVLAKEPSSYTEPDYETFFYGLLSTNREDGKSAGKFFSYIDKAESNRSANKTRSYLTSNKSFGFDFELFNCSGNTAFPNSTICLVVSYVAKDSPAYNAGIRRGHVIFEINGTPIKFSNYENLYPLLLTEHYTNTALRTASVTGYYFDDWNDTGVATKFSETLVPAAVNDNAVNHYQVIEASAGHNVGYMVYNAFESGYPDITNGDYNNTMKEAFRHFKANNIRELILDFRYNRGGLTSCAQLMCSMIKNSKAGEVFGEYRYNDYIKNKKMGGKHPSEKLLTMNQINTARASLNGETFYLYGNGQGVDLNVDKVYVLTDGNTASSSEMVILCLRGMGVDVTQIGLTTMGKRVGMTMLYEGGTFGDYDYTMWPISFYFHNGQGDTTPREGWVPEQANTIDPGNNGLFYPFGHEKEPLLARAMTLIRGGSPRSLRMVAGSGADNVGTMERIDGLPSSIDVKGDKGILKVNFE